jgi:hypothetical protein
VERENLKSNVVSIFAVVPRVLVVAIAKRVDF